MKHLFAGILFSILFLIFFLNPLAYAGAGWKTGYIDEPHRIYKSSIKIAADGTEYIAFGGGYPVYTNDPPGDDLMLAKRSPGASSQWVITAVDKDPGAEVGLDPSLALDSSGHPKISYYDSTNGNLKYASYNGTSWTIEIVDARPVGGNKVGKCPSLALDSNDAPRISYHGDNFIKYASYNGSTWDIKDVLYTNTWGFYNSLALDSNNNPHISYYESSSEVLRYAYFDGSDWYDQLVDDGGTEGDDVGRHNSIALTTLSGNKDQPRISYFDGSNNDLKYASWNGTSWDLSIPAAVGDVGEYSSLVLNSSNDWYTISHYDRTNDSLVVTSFNGIFGAGLLYDAAGGHYTSLTLDTDGKPAVSYRINKTGDLKIASHRPSLTTATIAADGNPYIRNRALAINPVDKPGIAYENSSGINQDIKFALYNGSTWDIQIVDAHWDNRYVDPSLAFDSDGKPIIAYHDSTNDELKLASWSGTSWAFDIVDNTDLAGKNPSIAIDSNNNPHISYYSVSNSGVFSLKYAVWTGSSWNIETIEDIGDWTVSSIGLTSVNNPRIAFYNRTTETLKVAVKESSNWTVFTVEAVGTMNWCHNTSLAIDNNDNIHVSYFNYTNADLKYARYSSGILNTQSVDTTNFVGMNNSIALNSSGRPGISYYDDTTDQYKYASFNGSSWDLQIVADSVSNSSSAVAIDSNDRIWIAYRDELKDDLKFAVSSKATFLPVIFQLLLSD